MNKINKGYKQTKVGIIPEDWEVVKLGEICNFFKGKGISKDDLSENGTPCIRYGELYTTYDEQIEKIYSKTNLNLSELFLSNFNDIIIPSSGETAQDIAKASCVLLNGVALGGDLNILRTSQNGIFLSYYLNHIANKDIAKIAQGISIIHLYASELQKLKVALPPFKEQEKIAEILTTWDKAIAKQEELIKENEKFKKALMQKLLSGKIRFSGFDGEWKVITLGEVCNISTGKLNANTMIKNGKYAFFTCAREIYKIDTFAFDTEALLISGNGANVGYIHYYNGKFNAYQRTYILDKFKDNILFVKYLMEKYLSLQIYREKNEGNTPYITVSTLTKMKLKLPPLAEQEKIAQILSLCDSKINLLKNELDELKLQKKSLMQKLLTGVVRVKV